MNAARDNHNRTAVVLTIFALLGVAALWLLTSCERVAPEQNRAETQARFADIRRGVDLAETIALGPHDGMESYGPALSLSRVQSAELVPLDGDGFALRDPATGHEVWFTQDSGGGVMVSYFSQGETDLDSVEFWHGTGR